MRTNFIKNISGFTIAELIVSIGIATMILSVVVFSYRTANDNLSLSAAGQEVAITIRQAQVYGLSVKESDVNSGSFTAAYGVYFDPVNSPIDYILYVDRNDNRSYDVGVGNCGTPTTECVQKFTLRGGVTFTGICQTVISSETCFASNNRSLDVVFKRPNPVAFLRTNINGVILDNSNPLSNLIAGKVVLTSTSGKTLNVKVQNTGQVYVQ